MCAALLSNGHTVEAELMADIRMFTEVDTSRSEQFRSNTIQGRRHIITTITPEKSAKTTKSEQSTSFKGEQSQKTRVGPRCYNCQLDGHIARDCTQPRRPLKCTKCKGDGHTAKYCKTDMPNVSIISTSTKNSAMYYIKEVRINNINQPVSGLVDTGSAFTIVKESIAKQFGLRVRPKTVKMWVYGNTQTVNSCEETRAVVQIDGVSECVPLIVVEDQVQQYDVIVGRSFTDCENVTFVKTNDQLLFAYDMQFPFQEEEDPCIIRAKYDAKIVHDTEDLPAKSAKMVEVEAGGEQFEIMLINSDDKQVNLHKNDKVGVVQKCSQILRQSAHAQLPITDDMVRHGSKMTKIEV